MHTLSVLPQLLTFGLVGPLLLRIAVAMFLFNLSLERFKKPYKLLSIVYAVSAGLIFIGLYTQIAVILGIIIIKADWIIDRGFKMPNKNEVILYSLLGASLLSILFTGPGFMAFDLPL
ncbi:MAG: hypothetical protein ABL899_01950 [Nitrospira sp.]